MQAREKVGSYKGRDGKDQKVDVSHIESTNQRLKRQQHAMQVRRVRVRAQTPFTVALRVLLWE